MTRHLLKAVISKAVYWKRSGELKTGHLRRQCWGNADVNWRGIEAGKKEIEALLGGGMSARGRHWCLAKSESVSFSFRLRVIPACSRDQGCDWLAGCLTRLSVPKPSDFKRPSVDVY
jgi:hypothetical protein